MSRTGLIFERVVDRELSIDLVVDAACWSDPEIEIARVRFDRIALRGADADASASEECSLAVWAFPHRFPLNHDFGTLAGGLGCFPLHDGR